VNACRPLRMNRIVSQRSDLGNYQKVVGGISLKNLRHT
jgi:hypothetical protein